MIVTTRASPASSVRVPTSRRTALMCSLTSIMVLLLGVERAGA